MSSSAINDRSDPSAAAEAQTWLRRVDDVAAKIRQHTKAIEADRQLTTAVLDEMHGAGLFRLSLPRAVGGGQQPVPVLARATQAIAAADASAGWCLGQGLGCAMTAAFLDAEPASEVFGPQRSVLAWGAGVQGTATLTDGGYLISGKWSFASGGKHATWIGAHCRVLNPDGTQVRNADGRAVVRTALFPRAEVQIHDDWHVMGLRGTRSESYTIDDQFVPARLTLDRETPSECREDAPLYVFPTTIAYASMFSGVALGIAGAMLNDLIELAGGKTARGARSAMKDSPVIQTRLAELRAQHGAAEAFQRNTVADVWANVEANCAISLDERVRVRLATTYAINEATAISEQVYRLAGSTAVFEDQPFEQRFRDAHAVSQQVQGRHTNYELVGRHMLGHDIDTMFL